MTRGWSVRKPRAHGEVLAYAILRVAWSELPLNRKRRVAFTDIIARILARLERDLKVNFNLWVSVGIDLPARGRF